MKHQAWSQQDLAVLLELRNTEEIVQLLLERGKQMEQEGKPSDLFSSELMFSNLDELRENLSVITLAIRESIFGYFRHKPLAFYLTYYSLSESRQRTVGPHHWDEIEKLVKDNVVLGNHNFAWYPDYFDSYEKSVDWVTQNVVPPIQRYNHWKKIYTEFATA